MQHWRKFVTFEELDDGVSHNLARIASVSLSSFTAESARLTEPHAFLDSDQPIIDLMLTTFQ